MCDAEKQTLQDIKDTVLAICDTMDIMISAITSTTINLTTLLSPIELLQKELMNNVVIKIDDMLEVWQ